MHLQNWTLNNLQAVLKPLVIQTAGSSRLMMMYVIKMRDMAKKKKKKKKKKWYLL